MSFPKKPPKEKQLPVEQQRAGASTYCQVTGCLNIARKDKTINFYGLKILVGLCEDDFNKAKAIDVLNKG